MSKITAIYVRRSVSDKDKDNNSFSIDSQKADCIRSLREGEEYRIYCDDGKSGKDIEHRPEFLQMMDDVTDGLIHRIVVKKLDRFSRSLRDFFNVTAILEEHKVSICSITESFDTATALGRMMQSLILSFAQFERETTSARVADAYITRAEQTGFYQGGKKYYGYEPERREVNGKKGSVLVPSDKAEVIKTAYKIYKEPGASLQDILDYCRKHDIDVNKTKKKKDGEEPKKTNMDRSHFSRLLESPLYVKADLEVYQYLVSKGYDILDPVEAFDGVHGLFRHEREDGTEYIKIGYHEGLVDSETWLAVQDKKSSNSKIPNNGGAKNSWLVGLTKCGHCGYAFNLAYSWNAAHTKQWRYYLDSGYFRADRCKKKRLQTKPDAVEQEVFRAMKTRLESLEIAKSEQEKPDTEVEAIKADIIRLDAEISKYMADYGEADKVMREYISREVNKRHDAKSDLQEKLRAKARKRKAIDTAPLADPMNRWDELSVDEKHALATTMLEVVYVSDENGIDIRFSI